MRGDSHHAGRGRARCRHHQQTAFEGPGTPRRTGTLCATIIMRLVTRLSTFRRSRACTRCPSGGRQSMSPRARPEV